MRIINCDAIFSRVLRILPGLLILSVAGSASGVPPKMAVLGDTQATTWLERVFLGREENTKETERLFQFLAQENAEAVIHLGDLVNRGSSERRWKRWDHLREFLGDSPVYPVLGNHEYWGPNSTALALVRERFPQLRTKTYYSKRFHSVEFLFLNSNIDDLEDEEREGQIQWLKRSLEALDEDATCKGIVVLTHHPPLTNSEVTGDDSWVRDSILPVLTDHEKVMALFSGHAHGYERFQWQGKTLIVSGGGGGPRVHYLQTKRHPDLYEGERPRPFHYLLLEFEDHNLKITVKGFQKGESLSQPRILETLRLPYPKS